MCHERLALSYVADHLEQFVDADHGSKVETSTYPFTGHDLVRVRVQAEHGRPPVVMHLLPSEADELSEQLRTTARRCRT